MFLHFIILLIFAHMLADYVFQWQGLVDRKKEGNIGAFLFHVIIFLGLAIFVTLGWLGLAWFICILSLSVLHAIQDVIKIRVQIKKPNWAFQLEMSDLFLHLFFIIVISIIFHPNLTQNKYLSLISEMSSDKFIIKMVIYGASLAFMVKGGTSLIRALLDQIGKAPPKQSKMIGFTAKNNMQNDNQAGESEYNVGRVIGNLERILLFVFVVLGNYAAIGFVIAAKSVARFKNLEDHNFAEYYLVGTLASCLIAITIGLVTIYVSSLI